MRWDKYDISLLDLTVQSPINTLSELYSVHNGRQSDTRRAPAWPVRAPFRLAYVETL